MTTTAVTTETVPVPPTETETVPQTTATALTQTLDEAFRIDLSLVEVTYNIVPDAPTLDGHATLTFTLRPGQTRALFHFAPLLANGTARDSLAALSLDGETLDPMLEDDLRILQFDGSDQEAFELQRDLGEGTHTLTMDWTIDNVIASLRPGWFFTLVDDTVGRGNDLLWPTINSPEELARHVMEIRITSDEPYVFTGSGLIEAATDGPVQVWTLDTVREVSSYTVMLAAAPEDATLVETFYASDVPVTIISEFPQGVVDQVRRITEETLAELDADFGKYPAPFLNLLLIDWDDGMEYYGATITGPGSVSHEIVHMYWGCSAVNRTWRDTWMDEAVDVWWESRRNLPRLPEAFTSGIVGGRHELSLGFDGRAYGPGALVFGEIASIVGGDEALIDILADLHGRRAFVPFTTDELLEDLVAASGEERLRDDFVRWLHTP